MSAKACLAHGAQSTPSRLRRGHFDQFTQKTRRHAGRHVGVATTLSRFVPYQRDPDRPLGRPEGSVMIYSWRVRSLLL